MKKRNGALVGTLLVVTCAGLGLVAGSGASWAISESAPSAEARPLVEPSAEANADYDLSVLETPVSEAMKLPPVLDPTAIAGGIVPESIREISSGGRTSTYIARANSGLLCLIVFLDGPDWVSGTTCTDPETFSRKGLGLSLIHI